MKVHAVPAVSVILAPSCYFVWFSWLFKRRRERAQRVVLYLTYKVQTNLGGFYPACTWGPRRADAWMLGRDGGPLLGTILLEATQLLEASSPRLLLWSASVPEHPS